MANVKISQLPQTSVVCNNALIPLVQNGVTCSTYACNLGGSGGIFIAGSGCNSSIRDGVCNTASGIYSAALGGCCNIVSGDCSVSVGGWENQSIGASSFVGGGYLNNASGDRSFIGGGGQNITSSSYGSVSGGKGNIVCGYYSHIGGGFENTSSSRYSAISGGFRNVINTTSIYSYSHIGGGFCNLLCCNAVFSSVGGGKFNTVSGSYSTIAGGCFNTASGCNTFIGSGQCNTLNSQCSSILSGKLNCNLARNSAVNGGSLNIIGCYNLSGATCLTTNSYIYYRNNTGLYLKGNYTTDIPIGSRIGYASNTDSVGDICEGVVTCSTYSASCTQLQLDTGTGSSFGYFLPFRILSRICNCADQKGISSSVGGGVSNLIEDSFSVISAGINNTISQKYSAIVGGYWNTISACGVNNASSIIGGANNIVSGSGSIAGGLCNIVSGNYSMAGGCCTCNTCGNTFQWNCLRATNLVGTTVAVCVGTDGILVRNTSDVRCKTDITPISYGLNEVSMLNPVSFNWCDDIKSTFGDNRQVGFIAQEVEKVIPEAVGQSADGVYSMDANKITPAMVKSIQELKSCVEKLESCIESLK